MISSLRICFSALSFFWGDGERAGLAAFSCFFSFIL
jgi:hypothetical protein